MSKKNKKNKVDYFNMTPEEQMANAEMFHDVEQGEVSFLDALNYKVPTGPIAQSDYAKQIERACLGMIEKDEDETYISEVDHAIGYVSEESDDTMESANDEDEYDDNTDDCDDESDEIIIPTNTPVYTSYSEVKSEFGIYKDPDEEKELVINDSVKACNNEADSSIADKDVEGIRPIYFMYEPIVGKMIIDDGLVPTAISVCHASSINLNDENIPDDSDAVAQLISKLFYYIITCKHPAVIMSEETFEIEFSLFEKINSNKFVMFKNNGFVYIYIMDEYQINNFYSVTDIFNMDDRDTLRFMLVAAFAAKSPHNIFMYDDEDEVDSVMDARHDVKYLLKLIDNDPDTKYAGHNACGDTLSRMKVTDLQTFIQDIYDTIESLIDFDSDEDDEDDGYDDSDESDEFEDDDDIDVTDYPDIDMTTDTDDIDQMLENIESTDDILASKVDSTDSADEDMTVPVIHRRS